MAARKTKDTEEKAAEGFNLSLTGAAPEGPTEPQEEEQLELPFPLLKAPEPVKLSTESRDQRYSRLMAAAAERSERTGVPHRVKIVAREVDGKPHESMLIVSGFPSNLKG